MSLTLYLCVSVCFLYFSSKTFFWVAAKKKRSFSLELLLYRSASPILLTAHCQRLFSCVNVVYNVIGLSFVVFVFIAVVFSLR